MILSPILSIPSRINTEVSLISKIFRVKENERVNKVYYSLSFFIYVFYQLFNPFQLCCDKTKRVRGGILKEGGSREITHEMTSMSTVGNLVTH